MLGRLGFAAGVFATIALLGGAVSQVHAQLPGSDGSRAVDFSNPGACSLRAELSNGTVVNPAESGGVYSVPHEGSATYTGHINQPNVPRSHHGSVKVSTPPLIPSINLRDPWKEDDAVTVDANGSVDWDIPSWVPGGMRFTVSGSHEDGGITCKGSIVVELDGSITSGALGWVAIVGTILTAVGLAWAALTGQIGGAVMGVVFGLLFGIFLAADLLFLGVIDFDSFMVLVVPLITALIGLGLGFFGPLRMALGRV